MGKTFSYDALEDDYLDSDYVERGPKPSKKKRKIKKQLGAYLEQKRARKNQPSSNEEY